MPDRYARKTDDTGEAQIIREEARQDMRELRAQSDEVDTLLRKLERRRKQNHFGRDLHLTFTRRRHT